MTEQAIFADPRSRALQDKIKKAATKEVAVLLTGPTGSGKEIVARELHALSRRKHQPFVPVNCGAIPHNLVESELFGSVRGAFTDAWERPGYLGQAQGGTLFLDEIGDLPKPQQVKLLRVLDGQPFCPVGSARERPCDVRFIAASNRDLESMCRDGAFRSDLYSRISQIPLAVPALAERPGDVEALARRYADNHRTGDSEFADRIVAAAMRLSNLPDAWPLGVRDLQSFVVRADCFGVGETEDDFEHRWRCGAGQPVRLVADSPPTDIDRERLAGLIQAKLATQRGRRRRAASHDGAMALAERLLDGGLISHSSLQEVLGVRDRRTLLNNLEPLIECGLLDNHESGLALNWPPVVVRVFCLRRGEWNAVPPGAIPLARGGDRIRIEVATQLPIEFRVFGVTHRRTGSDPRRPIARFKYIAGGQTKVTEFELDHRPGFEQILVHLSWPPHKGLNEVSPQTSAPFTPLPHLLQRERANLVQHSGPGWIEEYLVHHL